MARVLLVLMMLAGSARADVPSPEVEACRGKQVGDSCDGGGCAKTTCSRMRPDGPNGPMKTIEWECVQCVAGAPGSAGDGTWRIVAGMIVAVACVAGGVWFARRKRPQP
jgi:hypothetical protein